MKPFLLSLLLIFLAPIIQAQDYQFNYNAEGNLFMDGLEIDGTTTIEDIVDEIGEPNRVEETKGGESLHFYDSVGIVFIVIDEEIRGVGINYNWDQDERFPSKSFTGTLTAAGETIDSKYNQEKAKSWKTIELLCPIPLMCVSNIELATTHIQIAFKNNLITQVAFLVNNE